jgi:hypothetical protein
MSVVFVRARCCRKDSGRGMSYYLMATYHGVEKGK